MRKRSSKTPPDEPTQELAREPTAQPAAEPVREASAETTDGKNPAAVALGKLGGKKGGPARAAKLTKEQRAEIARKAARARWGKPAD
jgi:hypothetical protein